jgi:hypothetical protein
MPNSSSSVETARFSTSWCKEWRRGRLSLDHWARWRYQPSNV